MNWKGLLSVSSCPPGACTASRRLGLAGLCAMMMTVTGCREEKPTAAASASSSSAGTPPPSPADQSVLPSIPGFDPRSLTGREKAIMELADPAADRSNWESEAFSAEATAQLKDLAHLMESPTPLTDTLLAPLVSMECGATLPASDRLHEVFRDDLVVVSREKKDVGGGPSAAPGGPAAVFNRLMATHAGASDRRVSLKNFRYEEADGTATTTALFQSSGRLTAGVTQQNAVWACRWTKESPPRLLSVAVSEYERIEPAGDHGAEGGLRFVDATQAVAGGTASLLDQMTVGAGYWAGRLQKFYQIDSTAHQGLAIGDANGDGLEDIYVLQQGGLPNRLYVQSPGGTLRDVSAAAGVDWMELSHAALFVDLDNDGDQDLVISQSIRVLVMENLGNLRFETRFQGPSAASYFSIAAADYDGDGDLDIYACGYGPRTVDEYADGARVTVPLPYHDSRNGGPNLLLQNDGGWTFSDATAASGLNENNDRHSFAASWEDYDNDGDPDLYVANDFGRNNLYQNQGRGPDGRVTFRDVAAAAGVEDMSAGMGVTWGDYNRDGLMDLYVSNMFSAAGNRVAYQRQFRAGEADETLSGLRRHARGNSLFQNNGDGTFTDVSVESGVTMGRWAWGAQFADLNNDGWQDLYVANGYITGEAKDDL